MAVYTVATFLTAKLAVDICADDVWRYRSEGDGTSAWTTQETAVSSTRAQTKTGTALCPYAPIRALRSSTS